MIVFLTLTTAGSDTGPFDLYSNSDGYIIPFETGVDKATLEAGYSTTVPDDASIVRITSTGDCVNSVYITLRLAECDLAGYVNPIIVPSCDTLGRASGFVVLGSSTITNTGSSTLEGDVGLYPGTSITGFPPGLIYGTRYITDINASNAQTDALAAFTCLNALTPTEEIGADIGSTNLGPGIYHTSSSLDITGTLTLDGLGNPDAVFIFQIPSTFIPNTNAIVQLVGSAQACNVYWIVGSSATLSVGSVTMGNIIAQVSITSNTSATLLGRAFALTGAVTLDTNTFTSCNCSTNPCTNPPCNISITSTVTTDPDNIPGDNGTVTIVFEGGVAPFTYTLNSVPQGAATSPLVITGLISSTSYTVEITDNNDCSDNVTFTLGESTFYFNADYIMLTYEFTDGLDLDTRTRIAIPDIGQDTQQDYLGWAVKSAWPITGTPILTWGGDNQGTGFESVLIDIKQFKIDYPSATSFVVDARCFWYNEVGTNPVNVAATLWKGGTPVKDGCYEGQYYCWTNPTAIDTGSIDSVGIIITDTGSPNKALSSGQRAATLTYDLVTYLGVLNNNDTTTPSV